MVSRLEKIERILNYAKNSVSSSTKPRYEKLSLAQLVIRSNFIKNIDEKFALDYISNLNKTQIQKLIIADFLMERKKENPIPYLIDHSLNISTWSVFSLICLEDRLESFVKTFPYRKSKLVLDINENIVYRTFCSFVDYDFNEYKNRLFNLEDYRMMMLLNCIFQVYPPIKTFGGLENALSRKKDDITVLFEKYHIPSKEFTFNVLYNIQQIPELRY
jgi:hypothetical protein